MPKLLILLCGLCLCLSQSFAAVPLNTPNDKFSYTIGYQMGSEFTKDGLNLDGANLANAINVGLQAKQPKLDSSQQQHIINKINNLMQKKKQGTNISFSSQEVKNFSYALGYLMGKTYHDLQFTVNTHFVEAGLNDALNNVKPQLNQQQQKQIVKQMQQKINNKVTNKLQKEATMNDNTGEAFLKENATKPGVKTMSSGLQYKIIEAGKGAIPTASDTVKVNYEGKLLDGKVFDSSYKRGQPATFGVEQVIKGWTEALQMMPVGSTWELYIPADLAYGANGIPNVIPPNSTLIFKVELLNIVK